MTTVAEKPKTVRVTIPFRGDRVDLDLPLELVEAMMDFRSMKESGKIEVHYSQGGVAKVFANISRMYK